MKFGRLGIGLSSGNNFIKASAPAYDPDAEAFFTAASITDVTQKNSVNTLVLGLKAANIWAKIPCIYPFVGGNSASHSYNLKNPATFQLTFFGGWVHSITGALPNGTNAYAKTNFKPITNYAFANNNGHGFYTNTNILNKIPMGIYNAPDNAFFQINMDGAYILQGNIAANVGYTITNSIGHHVVQRFNMNDTKSYKNGVQQASSSVLNTSNTNIEFYLGARNFGGSADQFSNHNHETVHIHDDLTATNISNLSTLIYNYNNSLSRA